MSSILSLLQNYFGYTSFRPLQEEIISDIITKQDVFALMPTGAGKSLCYQIPALHQKSLTVVVSPLLSLMKDQVDGLRKNGIAAAYFNSTLSQHEREEIKRLLIKQHISLLYVSPERLMQPDFLAFLQTLSVQFFAIDEAHCISEWGHDFRQEYRELYRLREVFPTVPLAAFTATATQRVKQDIVIQLRLRNTRTYQASFDRPNLHYVVQEKQQPLTQILTYLAKHKGESGIIYCQARDTVDTLTKQLRNHGLRALPYHAGLPEVERQKHQEAFVQENVDIIVATIAFGMGIDKPNVRFVIHYDLPPNLERYYQETGRAGRDSLPSECVLLYSYADKRSIEYFISQKGEEEQRVAKHLLSQIVRFAESRVCRRKVLIEYFGESWEKEKCSACDNCLTPAERVDATIITQKILSCVYRVRERFGIQHIAQVLRGAKTQKIMRLHHHKLSCYGIVNEYSEAQLKTLISELLQLGYLRLTDDQYPMVVLTGKSKPVLLGKEQVFLHKPRISITQTTESKDQEVNHELFEKLRGLRKRIAEKESVPPYVIFSDVSLQDMASYYPQTNDEFSQVKGVGERKLQTYGDIFLQTIRTFCEEQGMTSRVRLSQKKEKKSKTKSQSVDETIQLFRQGLSIQEIARKRNFVESTIVGHIEQGYQLGYSIDMAKLISEAKIATITQAFEELGMDFLAPAKAKLGQSYSYEELRLVRAMLQKENKGQ